MKTFRRWYLLKAIQLCNYGLRFSDGANDQEDINDVVAIKNYFIRELEGL